MPTQWTCTIEASSTDCTVTATSSIGLYNGPNFAEWLFVGGVIVFIISFGLWARIFNPIKKMYDN